MGRSMKEEIIFTIDEFGNVSLEVNGVRGTSCLDFAKILEGLGKESDTKFKDEFYQTASTQDRVWTGGSGGCGNIGLCG